MMPAVFLIRRSRQRGVTLIEALVALMVMSFGMVALVTLMGNLRRSADVAKQRSEAVRLAQADLAQMRSFYTLEKPNPANPAEFDYENDVVSNAWGRTLADSNTTFAITRSVSELTAGGEIAARSVQVTVTWKDRAAKSTDGSQSLDLSTLVARVEPAFSGALSIAPPPGGIRQPQDRHPAIPAGAADLGNKTSAFRPSALANNVWVFSNVTGFVTQLCSIAPATALTLSNVAAAGCTSALGFLVSGTINFSTSNPANASAPEATALPLDMILTGGVYTVPRVDAHGAVVKDANGNVIMDPVTVPAPASSSYQCFDDAPSTSPVTQPFVNYSCVVFPAAAPVPTWSGSLQITGLNIGTTASDYRVCRYSADYNGNGNPFVDDRLVWDNYEHPATYANVTGSLPRQNFLVVKGDVSCPTAPAVNLYTGVFADYSTVQLQP
ncbi:MAG: type IV pilus modification PilV family protein [Roseateles sp.]|uniref:type IV pilus modification PilV family protein n=1 Tax=Roseateles sp. TaxID=1971397 RepID=UPI004036A4F4